MSRSRSLSPFLADHGSEKFPKRLVGKTDVEDALERLDTLTKEESLMAVTRNLKVTHRVDGNVMAVKGGVHGIKDVIRGIDSNIKDTKGLTEIIDDNVKATKHGTQRLLSAFMHVPTLPLNLFSKTVTEQLERSFDFDGLIVSSPG